MDASRNAAFDGLVEPFSLPCKTFGPDIMTFIHSTSDPQWFGLAVLQLKIRKRSDMKKAWATLDPDLFFYKNRTKDSAELSLRSDLCDAWTQTFDRNFLRTDTRLKKLVRLVLQCPARSRYSPPRTRYDSFSSDIIIDPDNISSLIENSLTELVRLLKNSS